MGRGLFALRRRLLKKEKSILHMENGGYRSFDIVVYNLILFYHGYIWDSIENIINVSHLTLKSIAKAGLFLYYAQFCIIIPAVNED